MTIFGYGKTTKAIVDKFGNCTVYDDKFSAVTMDKNGNEFLPPEMFDPYKSNLEVTSPGIPPSNPLIQKAQNLISEYDLFAKEMPYSIWITGTNGKTTTTNMMQHLLAERGSQEGGNVGSPLANLDQSAPIWILETSSFTLHYTNIAKPNLYIILPISPDHISWHGSFEAYEADKLKPLTMMQEGEVVILPKKYADYPSNAFKIPYESPEDLATYFEIDLNKINFTEPFLTDSLLALATTKILFDELDYEKINTFQIGSHRVERFRDKYKRLWINDSKATNVDATIAALKSYKKNKINLILGGDDKGADLTPLFEALKSYQVHIFSIGINSDKINTLANNYDLPCTPCQTLENAVKNIDMLLEKVASNSVNLLSPAAASLDQFTSYAQRGEDFMRFVQNLS
ncbi:MAG: UDP-N-acetylmuramoyl-L-alanine--D-glutamate ligase [Epsilonproteobacteria bacterium]|nr:UDP-N-acetylmuramoyl-L-alanine--D-glutamate ligase [Campylobacterota bacterium]